MIMERLTMEKELESLMNDFKNKWKPRIDKTKENGEDLYKFYRKNSYELLEDFYPIGEQAYMIDSLKGLGL